MKFIIFKNFRKFRYEGWGVVFVGWAGGRGGGVKGVRVQLITMLEDYIKQRK